MAIPGGLAFAIAQTLGFASFQETSLAIAAVIGAVTPLVIVIVAVPLFGERLSGKQIVLMVAGVRGSRAPSCSVPTAAATRTSSATCSRSAASSR